MIPISILATTYFPPGQDGSIRRQTFYETLISWRDHLKYNDEISLHIADDGSENMFDVIQTVNDLCPYLVSFLQQQRQGVGSSLNKGFKECFKSCNIVLYAVDDWKLTQDFDITSWVELLQECPDVGMVRLGPPHPHLTGRIQPYTSNWQSWALRFDKQHYAFAQRPALFHRRFIDAYGSFRENCSAMDCEMDYSFKTCAPGPDIVLALPHPWQHIYGVDLSEVSPQL